MGAREEILKRIADKHPASTLKSRKKTALRRLQKPERGLVPGGPAKHKKIVEHFISKAAASEATVQHVKPSQVGKAVCEFLRDHNLPQTLRIGADPRLANIDWPKKTVPEIIEGATDGRDLASLSHAEYGAAETGTLVLVSGGDNPTTNNFLPENHIVVINEDDIGWSYEDAWDALRKAHTDAGKTMAGMAIPRTINMITGPSRSADIEQTLILGAHGPVRLHVIIVKSATG